MITVNGKEVSAAGCSVSDYLEQNSIPGPQNRRKRNGEDAPKSQYAQTLLKTETVWKSSHSSEEAEPIEPHTVQRTDSGCTQ